MKSIKYAAITLVSLASLVGFSGKVQAQFYPFTPYQSYQPIVPKFKGSDGSSPRNSNYNPNPPDSSPSNSIQDSGQTNVYTPNNGSNNYSQENLFDDLLQAGQDRVNNQDYSASILSYDMAISIKPNRPEAYQGRSYSRFFLGNKRGALADANQAVSLDNSSASSYKIRSGIYLGIGSVSRTISDCNQAIKLNPNSYSCYINRGQAYLLKGDRQNAFLDLQKGEKLAKQQGASEWHKSAQTNVSLLKKGGIVDGIGLSLGQDELNQLFVISRVKKAPAEMAGVMPLDIISNINGLSTQNINIEQATKLIRGAAGSTVILTVLRNGKSLEFRLRRAHIVFPPIRG